MKKEFNLRNLHDLTLRLNTSPPDVIDDWRTLLSDEFDLSEEESKYLEYIAYEDSGDVHKTIQAAFNEALANVRAGGRMRLRVYKDPANHGRVLRLETNSPKFVSSEVFFDEKFKEPFPDEGTMTTTDLICCCANCRHWHRCGTRPNPCIPHN
ncbi:hypothetical protein [Ferirhizobium litorale]|uniref:Uncharacterized protein n=1 Tax=Ferirhizobium litorale TaxID=2927786 RepID=A0AAE3U4W3_9HYPH|nr:hypothetical protein [Fererhizobium litorale]MDI7923429.1 hypothetical protein [Fererhizobium litorale]